MQALVKKRIRSPGRKAVAKSLRGKPVKKPVPFMKNAPQEVAEDLKFYLLFKEWAEKGRDPRSPLVLRMRLRWNEIMGGADNGNSN